jgi:beta-ureidopropionase / N-carbamoyl-L-amino-acid hydrolase
VSQVGGADVERLEPQSDRLAADLEELATFRDEAMTGWSRQVFSEPYRDSRDWIRRRMVGAGLETHVDAAGNIVGRLAGEQSGSPALMTGSHTDTVAGGGRFDGIVGVLSGIEVARRLRETGTRLRHDLVVVDFLGEEANDFGISCMGSRAIAGSLTAAHLDCEDASGVRLGDAMRRFGCDIDAALSLGWASGSLHAYVELHVEQGPLLERDRTAIGIVTAIAGIERILVHFTGRADHAGTMPMDDRKDALAAAAAAVLIVEREGCGAPASSGVATTGRIESGPGAMNVVPDRASIWAELRSTDRVWLQGARRNVVEQIAAEAERRGVHQLTDWLNDQDPVPTHQLIQDRIGSSAQRLGHSWKAVPSGAGHDAAHLAHLGPMGMIFIPSIGGRSHCPEELSTSEDLAAGAHVLAATLVALDNEL